VRVLVLLFALTIVQSASLSAHAASSAQGYRLAPGDRINVTVHDQPDLSGEYLVDGTGEIQVPLIYGVRVERATVDEVSKAIAEKLRSGLLKNPIVSVRISEFRPIYVMGDVRAPGTFPFRFGLNGMSAIALAGGVGRTDGSGGLADVLGAEERVESLSKLQLALQVRLARLEAERDDKDTFTSSEPTIGDNELGRIVREEQAQLRVLRSTQAKTIELLDRQRPQILAEIDATKEQIRIETGQLNLVRQSLKSYAAIQKKGFGRSVTQIDYQRQAADREGLIARLKGDLARLESKQGELDLKAQELENARQIRVSTELRDVNAKLAEIDIQLPAAKELLGVRQNVASTGGDADGFSRTHRVMLTRAGVSRPLLPSDANLMLEPGDIVEVHRLKGRGANLSSLPSINEQSLRVGPPLASQ
jgi:polysaccharide export outer membrane protein